jgi:hypothetical protein
MVSVSKGEYRYGFNGYEKDDDVKGEANHISFGDYGYDPRIGRRWKPDPLESKYPSISPFVFAAGSPLIIVDKNGQKIQIYYKNEKGEEMYYVYGSKLEIPNNAFVKNAIETLDYIKIAGKGEKPETSINLHEMVESKVLEIRELKTGAFETHFEGVILDADGNVLQDGAKADLEKKYTSNFGTIYFNPTDSISNKEKTEFLSPAAAFSHELGHATGAFFSTNDYLARISTKNSEFKDDEEKFAIEYFELPIAKYRGEYVRTNYSNGSEFYTNSPLSNEPIETQKDKPFGGTEVELKKR